MSVYGSVPQYWCHVYINLGQSLKNLALKVEKASPFSEGDPSFLFHIVYHAIIRSGRLPKNALRWRVLSEHYNDY